MREVNVGHVAIWLAAGKAYEAAEASGSRGGIPNRHFQDTKYFVSLRKVVVGKGEALQSGPIYAAVVGGDIGREF